MDFVKYPTVKKTPDTITDITKTEANIKNPRPICLLTIGSLDPGTMIREYFSDNIPNYLSSAPKPPPIYPVWNKLSSFFRLLDQQVFFFKNLSHYLDEFLGVEILQAVQMPAGFLRQFELRFPLPGHDVPLLGRPPLPRFSKNRFKLSADAYYA
jgi:hypothetical protein